jgi:hypothetical protein
MMHRLGFFVIGEIMLTDIEVTPAGRIVGGLSEGDRHSTAG